MKSILISIDHKWRDLPGHVLLGEELHRRGFAVSYCRNGLEKYYLENEHFDCVIINHILEKKRRDLVDLYALQGVKFVILPTEGIPTLEEFTDFALGVDLNYSNIACYAFWNTHYLQRFAQNSTLNNDNTYIAGVPRFDFYKQKTFKGNSELEFGRNPNSKKILWATNFYAGTIPRSPKIQPNAK